MMRGDVCRRRTSTGRCIGISRREEGTERRLELLAKLELGGRSIQFTACCRVIVLSGTDWCRNGTGGHLGAAVTGAVRHCLGDDARSGLSCDGCGGLLGGGQRRNCQTLVSPASKFGRARQYRFLCASAKLRTSASAEPGTAPFQLGLKRTEPRIQIFPGSGAWIGVVNESHRANGGSLAPKVSR